MNEKKFLYADSAAQVQKVNRFLCISTSLLYLFSYAIVFISMLQGNRTPAYGIIMFAVMLTTLVMGFVTLKKDSGSKKLRYYMMVGLCIVAGMLIYAYVDYYMRFLAVMPFLGCILFFDTAFMMRVGIIVAAENVILTLVRQFVSHTYTSEEFTPNLVAGIAVTLLMFVAYYLTRVGKAFNTDSLGKVQHEAEVQKEMVSDVLAIAERVRTGTTQAMDIVNELQDSSETVNQAVGDICNSTASTADSIQNQNTMTHEIQEHLEDTVIRAEGMVKASWRAGSPKSMPVPPS